MLSYFGTDGIRGTVGKELTIELAVKVGKSLSYFTEQEVYVGYDTRISNHMIASAIIAGALSISKNVYDVGIISTPGLAYYSKKKNAIGIMITASHNPYTDNGIKIFYHGLKLANEQEKDIEALIDNLCINSSFHEIGHYIANYLAPRKQYVDYLISLCNRCNKKIAIDTANGASYQIAPFIFSNITSSLYVIGDKPDGYNINKDVGSTHIETLMEFVKANKCDIGFAYDGDGDRLIVVDEEGKVYTGDEIIYVIANDMLKENKLTNNTVVLTHMSNLGIINSLKEKGINVVLTDVGDKNVLQEMIKNNYVLGGENSGHIINLNYLHTGDGVLSSVILCNILAKTNKSLKELTKDLKVYPDKQINLSVKDKNIAKRTIIQNEVKRINLEYKGDLKLIVRRSGTEDVIRIYCSSRNKEDMNKIINQIILLIKDEEKKID